MENGTALIRMEGVKKVFLTDEMETHALADIHLEIRDGEFAEGTVHRLVEDRLTAFAKASKAASSDKGREPDPQEGTG